MPHPVPVLLLNTYLTRNLCCFCAFCLVPCALRGCLSALCSLGGDGCSGQEEKEEEEAKGVCDWRKMLRLICFRQAPSQAKPNAAQAVVDASTKTRKAKEEERERE